jgi:hypothetical protein
MVSATFSGGEFQQGSKLVGAGRAFKFLLQLRESLVDLVQRSHLVQRQAHNAALLGQCLQNALADPPHGVADEFENPRVSSKRCAALIRPRFPSLIKSGRLRLGFWYCLATETTKRRLAFTKRSKATPVTPS